MFLKRTISSVISNDADETEERIAGKSFPHCVGLIIFRARNDCNVLLFPAKTMCIFPGPWMASNVFLSA